VCQEKFKDAIAAFVKRKINNLRSAFRRELNKVLESKTTGLSADDIYVPTLWYMTYCLLLRKMKVAEWEYPV
jgi:hypothetical protein